MKQSFWSALKNGLYTVCHGVGTGVLNVAALGAVGGSYLLAGVRYALSAVSEMMGWTAERFYNGRGRSHGGVSVARSLFAGAKAIETAASENRTAFRKEGVASGLRKSGQNALRLLRSFRKAASPVLNVAVPLAAVVICVLVVREKSDFSYGISVVFKGEALGIVQDEDDFDKAVASIGNRVLAATGETYRVDVEPIFELVTVPGDYSFASVGDLEQGIIGQSPELFRESAGLYINGELIAVTDRPEVVEMLMNTLKNEAAELYKDMDLTDAKEVTVDFVDDVKLTEGLYPVTARKTVAEIESIFRSLVNEEEVYTVQSGDSPKRIASKFDLSLKELYAMNPGMEGGSMYPGDQVVIGLEKAYLPICLSYVSTYEEETAIPIVYIDSDDLYMGVTKKKTDGEAGIDRVTAKITYVNGVETARLVQETVSVKEAVASEVYKGTQRGNTLPTIRGFYIRPINGGRITSRYGNRKNPFDSSKNNFHSGQDIAAPKNTPIYAARTGVVTFMGVSGSYGNLVKIDHGDGYVTFYGHCNGFASGVKVGDRVEVGTHIAYVGSTGRSTGNHVHFELRYNNQSVNTNGLFAK